MKKISKNLLSLFFLLATTVMFSQGKIKGTVVDSELNSSLPGVNVVIKGTTSGTTTDFDGNFTLNATTSGQVVLSYVGYQSATVNFTVKNGETVDLGTIKMNPDSNQLDEVVLVGKGIIDLAKDRKTPIAVSSIKASDIQAKIGTADITQTLVNTPSVYVAGQAGGFGDSRISVRGFQQDNTAFLLNGQPINGMEDGKMYWSNWSGMSDIANLIQVQRGLGSSKLAISSVGGTVNFITKATDMKEGGFVSSGIANDNYIKNTVAYNTGMNSKGWGASVMLSQWQGDGYNEGTKGAGQNYFFSVGYKANDKHNFNFLITGAPQWHDQNFSKAISDYLGFGRKYNNNYGYLNGKYISERKNFYHKPVANLNWDYKMSDKTTISSVLYASWGRGGGTGNYGSGKKSISKINPFTNAAQNTYIDFDKIYSNNVNDSNGIGSNENGQPVGFGLVADPYRSSNYVIRSSMNNHAWYGLVSNLNTKISNNLNLNFGLDLRTYKGEHYRQVANFLGLNSWYETRRLYNQNHANDIAGTTTVASNTVNQSLPAEPWKAFFKTIDDNQKIDYNYSETISYGGLFGQLEYQNDNVSAFFQGAVSNQSHQRTDYYDYESSYQKSDKVNNIGYNVKAGGSYNLNEKNSFYFNTGYYSRQPYHDNVYLNFTNFVNPNTSNEKILGLEAGYTFKTKLFTASLNLYKTEWKDRVAATSSTITNATTTIGTTLMNYGDVVSILNSGLHQEHYGAELDFIVKPFEKIDISGFGSYGDWKYKGVINTKRFDDTLKLLDEKNNDVDGGKVGDAAQLTWGIGAKYKFVKNFSLDVDWRNYDKVYANAVTKNNIELPTYDLVDAGISYKMEVGNNNQNSVNFRININNVFDEVYLSEISQSTSSGNVDGLFPINGTDKEYRGINVKNNAYFGLGRTWNVSIRFNF